MLELQEHSEEQTPPSSEDIQHENLALLQTQTRKAAEDELSLGDHIDYLQPL